MTESAPVAAPSAITNASAILTGEALALVAELERRFGPTRRHVLDARARRAAEPAGGAELGLLPATAEIRHSDWRVAPIPAPLLDRRVEITGPVTDG